MLILLGRWPTPQTSRRSRPLQGPQMPLQPQLNLKTRLLKTKRLTTASARLTKCPELYSQFCLALSTSSTGQHIWIGSRWLKGLPLQSELSCSQTPREPSVSDGTKERLNLGGLPYLGTIFQEIFACLIICTNNIALMFLYIMSDVSEMTHW